MFERFTEEARMVVVLAQEEARALNHNYIGTEHLLLGLIREDGEAARALERAGLTHQVAQDEVVAIVGRGAELMHGQMPFTPHAKKTLELALREALALDHNYIAPFHLALALLREGGGTAARVMTNHGLEYDTLLGALDLQPPGRRGGLQEEEVVKLRLTMVEDRLAAWQRRSEIIEIVGTAPNPDDARARVAELLGITPMRAGQVVGLPLYAFAADALARLEQEREELQKRLES